MLIKIKIATLIKLCENIIGSSPAKNTDIKLYFNYIINTIINIRLTGIKIKENFL